VLPFLVGQTASKRTTTKEGLLISKEPRVNEKIRAREVRLVDPDGGQIGIKGIDEARWLADQLGLDLVEVAADSRPPVVRMMDYGKFKYEASVRAREARKKQTRTVIKEVQFRPKIGQSDFDVKRKRVLRFLGEGDKVKVTMRFRGREVTHPEIGRDILRRLTESVDGLGVVETPPRLDGRQMTLVLAPVSRSERKKYLASQAESEAEEVETTEEADEDLEALEEHEVAVPSEVAVAAAIDAEEVIEAIEASEEVETAEAADAVEVVEALEEIEAVEAIEAIEAIEAVEAVEAVETIEAGDQGQEPATT
jgi:translation initiation factor IF-3